MENSVDVMCLRCAKRKDEANNAVLACKPAHMQRGTLEAVTFSKVSKPPTELHSIGRHCQLLSIHMTMRSQSSCAIYIVQGAPLQHVALLYCDVRVIGILPQDAQYVRQTPFPIMRLHRHLRDCFKIVTF